MDRELRLAPSALVTSALAVAIAASIGCSPMPRNSALHWDAATTRAPEVQQPIEEDAEVIPPPEPEPVRDAAPDLNAPDVRDAGSAGNADTGARPEVAAETQPTAGTCGVKVTVTTRTLNMGYAPRNAGAIWIANQTGRFVKSLNVWANRRLRDLERWTAATAAAGLPNNRVDAVTAATMTNHALRTGTWNCTDANKAVVADGPYQVCFEMDETSGTSQYQCVPFSKSDVPVTVMPPDTPAFRMRIIEFTP